MINEILEQGSAMPMHVRFRSTLLDGYYDYNLTTPQEVMRLKPNAAIYIDGISFSAGCKTWDFSSAAADGIGVQFNTVGGREPVLLRQIKYFSFSDFMRLNSLVQSKKPVSLNGNLNRQDDYLTIGINGRIRQTEALIKDGKAFVDIMISVAAYEITDLELIKRLTRQTGRVVSVLPPPPPMAAANESFQRTEEQRKAMPPPVKTTDPPPPLSLRTAKVWRSGNVGVEAWEDNTNG